MILEQNLVYIDQRDIEIGYYIITTLTMMTTIYEVFEFAEM